MKTWVPVNAGTIVHYPFQADDDYIANYGERVVDPAHLMTPDWYTKTTAFVDVTGVDPLPTIGFTLSNGQWAAPPVTAEEQAALDAAAQQEAARAADDSFVTDMRAKIDAGDALTDEERDKLAVIQAERGAIIPRATA